jgi:hypothetical protein
MYGCHWAVGGVLKILGKEILKNNFDWVEKTSALQVLLVCWLPDGCGTGVRLEMLLFLAMVLVV